jgi:hypothetical protein
MFLRDIEHIQMGMVLELMLPRMVLSLDSDDERDSDQSGDSKLR